MKRLLLVNLILITCLKVSAQDIVSTRSSTIPSSGIGVVINYSITPLVGASNWVITNPLGTDAAKGEAANTVFTEFGDGTFSFLPQGSHEYYLAETNRQPITKITGVYGGGGRPPKHRVGDMSNFNSTFSIPAPSLLGNYKPMNILHQAGEKLAITPNINSVVHSDTMIFVITYKLAVGEKKSLLFLYNDNAITPAFEAIGFNQKLKDNTTGETTNFVRCYTSEIEDAVLSSTSVAIQNIESKYADAISISNLKADGVEHNVFITLIPKEKLLSTDLSQTDVKAILAPTTNRGGKLLYDTASTPLPIFDVSHDPNYIIANPSCFALPKDNKEVKYRVHFQNTGCGNASKVDVVVKFSSGLNLSNNFIFNKVKVDNGILMNTPIPAGDSIVFRFDRNISDPTINCTLEGMGHSPTCFCNEKTMGDIWFTIKLDNASPDIFHSQAHIIFFNSSPIYPNPPIYTNTAYSQFRACCECEQKCNPCKRKKGVWKWLFCKKC